MYSCSHVSSSLSLFVGSGRDFVDRFGTIFGAFEANNTGHDDADTAAQASLLGTTAFDTAVVVMTASSIPVVVFFAITTATERPTVTSATAVSLSLQTVTSSSSVSAQEYVGDPTLRCGRAVAAVVVDVVVVVPVLVASAVQVQLFLQPLCG